MTQTTNIPQTEVVYNGDCPICSREIASYARYTQARGVPVTYTDLTQTDLAAHGLTPTQAAQRLHVIKDGVLISGLPAFVVLWAQMPRFAWLARFVSLPVVRPVATALYDWVLAPSLYAMHKRRQSKQPMSAKKHSR